VNLDIMPPAARPSDHHMLSIVIPVYNEGESLDELHAELAAVTAQERYDAEFIFVDDGSKDGSWDRIVALRAKDPRVRGIRFRRNFGKAAALSAGFSAARGELVMTLDADLQDDPKEIPNFLAKMSAGLDVVSGWKKVRHDPWHKVLPSRIFNWMVSTTTGVKLHDHNCGMKSYRREIFDEVQLYGELHRFVPVLAEARGWKVGEIVIQHRERKHGISKYGVRRFVKGFLDLLTVKFIVGFGRRPQHLLGTIGLISFVLGFAGLFILSAWWCISRLVPGMEELHLHTRALFYYSITGLILGAQFISIGFLAEMINARSHRETDGYSVSERLGIEPNNHRGTEAQR
jgi:dolichol-phosphate mannosyltransferase